VASVANFANREESVDITEQDVKRMDERQLVAAIEQLQADASGRQFSDEERDAWNIYNEALDEYRTRMARLRELASKPGALEPGADWGTRDGSVPGGAVFHEARGLRGQALTANERTHRMPDPAREHMARQLEADDDPEQRLARYVVATSKPEYFRAFAAWMRDPEQGHLAWTAQEREAWQDVKTVSRAMGIGTPGVGGALVPFELDPQILIAGIGSVNPMRSLCRVETTAFNEKRFVTGSQMTAHWYTEGTEVSDDSPPLLQPSILCRKAMAFVPLSFELLEDSDISQQIGNLFADAKDQLE
jgi:HK97 family phage major capsid protein